MCVWKRIIERRFASTPNAMTPDDERSGCVNHSWSKCEARTVVTYAARSGCALPSSVVMYTSHGHGSERSAERFAAMHGALSEMSTKLSSR